MGFSHSRLTPAQFFQAFGKQLNVRLHFSFNARSLCQGYNQPNANRDGQAAQSLEKIGTGNLKALEALIKVLETTEDQDTRRQAAQSLGKIDLGNPKAIEALIKVLETTEDQDTYWQAADSLGKIGTGNPQAIAGLIELLRTSRKVPARKQAAYCLEKIGISNLKAIAGLRELLRTHQNPYTRLLVTEVLEKITPLTKEQTQQAEDDLLLFLQVTRVKETVDQYFSVNNYKKAKFCYHRIVACLDRLQEGRDLITRRSLMKSYLDIYQRIVSFSIKIGDFKSAFFYTELFRNRYLVERIAQQDAPLPNTVTPDLSVQIEQAKLVEKRTLQDYTDGISRNLDEQQLEQLERKWEEAKTTLQNRYTQVAVDEPEFIAKTKVSPLSFQQIQALLSSDTAILEFFFTANKLVTILILPEAETPQIPESLTLELKSQSLETLAKALIFDITAKTTSKKTE